MKAFAVVKTVYQGDYTEPRYYTQAEDSRETKGIFLTRQEAKEAMNRFYQQAIDNGYHEEDGMLYGNPEDGDIPFSYHVEEHEVSGANVETILCLSTAHLTPETADLIMDGYSDSIPPVFPKTMNRWPTETYGAFVYVPSYMDDMQAAELIPGDLKKVLDYASDLGVTWIMFDADESEIDALPTYQW